VTVERAAVAGASVDSSRCPAVRDSIAGWQCSGRSVFGKFAFEALELSVVGRPFESAALTAVAVSFEAKSKLD